MKQRPFYGTMGLVSWKKVLIYNPAQKEIGSWPIDVKKELGSILTTFQKGESLGMPEVRAMPNIAKGASEIRLGHKDGTYRAFFVIQTEVGILVFHGFQKKTQKTPIAEIHKAQERLKNFLKELEI